MVQVDLITGFLGAGKTTFLRRYAAWWAGQGVKVCVLENDFGAVNVDAMLLQDLEAQGVELETISGGCDCDTHQRRMRTKLISMAMRGFERVIVEPSGIFDVDEFFDVLRDDPLDRWYHIGNVIAIVDAMLPETLSPQAEYVLASETANAGRVLVSRTQLAGQQQTAAAVAHLTTIKTRVPFIHFHDGFRTSHEIQKVAMWDYKDLAEMCDMDAVQAFRDHALNPEHPHTRGSHENGDIFFQNREACNKV